MRLLAFLGPPKNDEIINFQRRSGTLQTLLSLKSQIVGKWPFILEVLKASHRLYLDSKLTSDNFVASRLNAYYKNGKL